MISLLLLSSMAAFAQKEITVKSKVKSVSVYLQGAELFQTATTTVPGGTSIVVIQGLPGSINPATLQAGSKDVVIQSAEFRVNYLKQGVKSARIKAIEDSLELLRVVNVRYDNERQLANDQIAILLANKSVGGANSGVSVAELTKLMDYYASKAASLKNTILEVDLKDAKNQERINNLSNQLNAENSLLNVPSGEAVIQVMANGSKTTDFNLSYLVTGAGWTPIYDLRCESIKSPVKLNYKAQVWQNTGLNWDNVKLTINTGNPNEGGTNPVLQPWYLSFTPTYAYDRNDNYRRKSMAPAPQAAPSVNNTLSTTSSAGYAWSDGSESLNKYVTINESQLNASFDIELAYDIPSDGKVHLVNMVDYDLPATYEYYAAPKLDKDAFLLARITDWEKLNLLPAKANIFFEGNYVGQSDINPNSTRDTLSLPMGRDKKIIIKRTKVKDYNATKVIGLTRKETSTYEIVVRNTKKEPVVINLVDQYPLTTDKEIEIELLDSSKAYVDAEKGQLLWKFTINGSDTKTYRLSYSVKYPKDKVLSNLN